MAQRKHFSSIRLFIIIWILLKDTTGGIPNRKIEESHNINQRGSQPTSKSNDFKENNNASLTYNNYIHKRQGLNFSTTPNNKYWYASKISRKQYELINMLWRKTKIFVDVESNNAEYKPRRENLTRKAVNTFRHLNSFQVSLPRPIIYSSTPSYFEFYYLHEIDDRYKRKDMEKDLMQNKAKGELQNEYDNFELVPKTPVFAFRVFDNYKSPQVTPHPFTRSGRMYSTKRKFNFPSKNHHTRIHTLTSVFRYKDTKTKATLSVMNNSSSSLKVTNENHVSDNSEYYKDTKTCLSMNDLFGSSKDSDAEKSNNAKEKNVYHVKATTLYDKIKFFETYDKHTQLPQFGDKKLLDIVFAAEASEITQRKNLENIDQGFSQNNHTKKHIIERRNKFNEKCSENRSNRMLKTTTVFNSTTNNKINTTETLRNRMKLESTVPKTGFNNVYKSASVSWSEYPFAAVYIYEPLQVHCDAAAISPHWLIAAGSCLFRHHKNPGGEGQSAFVAYCGERWWRAERVAYVKYSLVHPRYHPRDKTRRTLYNIGVIQVVSSMASSCTGWSPISLMSHQFAASENISKASAIGWGLDRFDMKYSSMELPKWPLMSYLAPVHSDSCPGNIEYSKIKRHEDYADDNNVYCLLLPPYAGEEADPVHGSLLLIGENLIALYLQEERRPWGSQSAQYTGTWRLIPWVLDMAREPEEADTFTVDM